MNPNSRATPADPVLAEPSARRRRITFWLAGFAAATAFSLLVATQNWMALHDAGRPRPWTRLLLVELPVWYVWLGLTPIVFALGRRFPLMGPGRGRNLAVHVVAGLVLVFISHVLVFAVLWPLVHAEPRMVKAGFVGAIVSSYRRGFAVFLVIYFTILALYHAVQYYRESQRKTLRESQLETLLERTQRDVLRMQLHPHFLFNTLHAISALMEKDVHSARRMITRLSDLLRLSLTADARHEVSLDEELEFLDKYLEIQKIRFGDRLSVTVDADADARRVLVPRLLLQPLVENSITHGLASKEGPGWIGIEARQRDGLLSIRVLDDGVGLPEGGPHRSGVGLANTRARLERLYGPGQRFELRNRAGGGCEVVMELPAAAEVNEDDLPLYDPADDR